MRRNGTCFLILVWPHIGHWPLIAVSSAEGAAAVSLFSIIFLLSVNLPNKKPPHLLGITKLCLRDGKASAVPPLFLPTLAFRLRSLGASADKSASFGRHGLFY